MGVVAPGGKKKGPDRENPPDNDLTEVGNCTNAWMAYAVYILSSILTVLMLYGLGRLARQ